MVADAGRVVVMEVAMVVVVVGQWLCGCGCVVAVVLVG